jgi:hypothetical protein
MTKNQSLDAVYDSLLKRNLSDALQAMAGYFSLYSGGQDVDRLYTIQADFQLMADYWKRGFKDPQLSQLYNNLLRRLYVLYADAAMRYEIKHTAYLSSIHAHLTLSSHDWSFQALKDALEEFVTANAMLSLEPAHTQVDQKKAMHRRHQQLLFRSLNPLR